MAKFTKVPVEIDAILAGEVLDGSSSGRFSEQTLRHGETLMPQWVIDAFTSGVIGFESQGGKECVVVVTHHGMARAERDAWIIRGIDGELYPCVPDVFARTYQPAGAVLTIKGDMDPEKFAAFRKEWDAAHLSVSRAIIQDANPNGDLLDSAWGIIANAGGGDWSSQTEEWREAARRWRDEYHKTFPSHGVEAATALAEAWNNRVRTITPVWTPEMIGDAPRDELQKKMLAWSIECFGHEEATSLSQRALRLLEEAVELAQSAGVTSEMARVLIDFVFDRPSGTLSQEVGGVSITLLVLCAAAGISANVEERREIERVLSKPPSHFTERNAKKNAAGLKITHIGLTERGLELGGTRKVEDLPTDTMRAGYEVEVSRDGDRYNITEEKKP